MGHSAGQGLGAGHLGLWHQPLPFWPSFLVTSVLQAVVTSKKQHWTRKQDTWVLVAAPPLASPQSSRQACLPQSLHPLRRMRRPRFTSLLCL